MNFNDITFEVSSVIAFITAVGGYFKIRYDLKEKLALQKKDWEHLKEQCDVIKGEFEKLEDKVENNREEVLKHYSELKAEIHGVSIGVERILAIMENQK